MAEQKQQKDKKNRSMFKIIGIVVIVGTAIAIVLNIGQTVISIIQKSSLLGITAGDWLEFWGTYIGGIATLGGVSLTLWKSDKDKKEAKEKEKPFIVPLKTKHTHNLISSNSKLKSENDKPPQILINIVNLGKEHALNLQVTMKHINYSMIEERNKRYGIVLIDKKKYYKLLSDMEKMEQIIDSQSIISEGREAITLHMYGYLCVIIERIIINMYYNQKGIIGFIQQMPICTVEFKFNNNVGESFPPNKYMIYVSIFSHRKKETDESGNNIIRVENEITLTFKSIDKKK